MLLRNSGASFENTRYTPVVAAAAGTSFAVSAARGRISGIAEKTRLSSLSRWSPLHPRPPRPLNRSSRLRHFRWPFLPRSQIAFMNSTRVNAVRRVRSYRNLSIDPQVGLPRESILRSRWTTSTPEIRRPIDDGRRRAGEPSSNAKSMRERFAGKAARVRRVLAFRDRSSSLNVDDRDSRLDVSLALDLYHWLHVILIRHKMARICTWLL